MPNSALERAKALAKTLRRALRLGDAELPLSICQQTIAVGFGRRSWMDFARNLSATSALTGWDSHRALVYLTKQGISDAQATSALSRVDLQMLERRPGTEDVTARLLSLQLPTKLGVQKWSSRAKPLLRSDGVAMFVHDVTEIISQPGWAGHAIENVLHRNVERSQWNPDQGREFLEQFRLPLEEMAARPRHSAWPAICFLTLARVALIQGSQERLMKLDVWQEIDLIMIAFNGQIIQGRVEDLGSQLWNLDPHVRRGIAINAANDAADMIINLCFEERKMIPFGEMPDLSDHELKNTSLEDDTLQPDAPYSTWTKRWKRLAPGDIAAWAAVDEEHFHNNLHIRVTRDLADPDLIHIFDPTLFDADTFKCSPTGDAFVMLLGQGDRLDEIRPVAFCAIDKMVGPAKASITVGPLSIDEDFPEEDASMAFAGALGCDIEDLVAAARHAVTSPASTSETNVSSDRQDAKPLDDSTDPEMLRVDLDIIDNDGWTELPSALAMAAEVCRDMFGPDMGCDIVIHRHF